MRRSPRHCQFRRPFDQPCRFSGSDPAAPASTRYRAPMRAPIWVAITASWATRRRGSGSCSIDRDDHGHDRTRLALAWDQAIVAQVGPHTASRPPSTPCGLLNCAMRWRVDPSFWLLRPTRAGSTIDPAVEPEGFRGAT